MAVEEIQLDLSDIPEEVISEIDLDISEFEPEESSEIREAFSSFAEGAINSPARLYDPVGTAKGEFGVDLSQSQDFEDKVFQGLAQGITDAGIIYTSGLAGAGIGTAIGAGVGAVAGSVPGAVVGAGVGSKIGFAAGMLAGTATHFTQGLRSSLASAQEELKAKIKNEEGREATEDELNNVWYRSLPTTILGQGLDSVLALATAGTGKTIITAGKEVAKTAAKELAEDVGETAAKEVVKSEVLKAGVQRLGDISKSLGKLGVAKAALTEGAGEAVEGAGQRAAVKSVAEGESFGDTVSRLPGELATKQAAEDFAVGAIVQGTIRGAVNTAASRAEAKAAGGDIDPTVELPPAEDTVPSTNAGLEVLERAETNQLTPADQKALILNKVAADLEDLGVEQNEAIIPADFANSATIQEALKNQKNLRVEALEDGSTKIAHLPEVETNYEATIKDRSDRAKGMQLELKKIQKEKEVIQDSEARLQRQIDRKISLANEIEQKRAGIADTDPEQAAALDTQLDSLQESISKLQEQKTKNSTNAEKLADLSRKENILQANLKGVKFISESGKELDFLDAELEIVKLKKSRLEEQTKRYDKRIETVETRIKDLESKLAPEISPETEQELTNQIESAYNALESLETKKVKAQEKQQDLRSKLDVREQEILDKLGGQRFELEEGQEAPGRTIRSNRAQQRAIQTRSRVLDTAIKTKQKQLDAANNRLQKLGKNAKPETRQVVNDKIFRLQQELETAKLNKQSYDSETSPQLEGLKKQAGILETQILQENLSSIRKKRGDLDAEISSIDKQMSLKERQIARLEKSLVPELKPDKEAQIREQISDRQAELVELEIQRGKIELSSSADLDTLSARESELSSRLDALLLDPTSGNIKEGKQQLSFGERLATAANLRQTAAALNADRAKNGFTAKPVENTSPNSLAVKNPSKENISKLASNAEQNYENVKKGLAKKKSPKNYVFSDTSKVVFEYIKKQLPNRFRKGLAENLLVSRNTTPDIVNIMVEAGFAKQETANKVLRNIEALKKASTKEEYGSKLLNEALAGNTTAQAEISPELLPLIQQWRQDIKDLGRELKASGAVEGDVLAIIDANEDTYLHRNYKLIQDPAWFSYVTDQETEESQKLFNDAKSVIRDQLVQAETESDEDFDNRASAELKAMLYDLSQAGNMVSAIQSAVSGKNRGKDLSILTARKEIHPAIRAVFGEVDAAPANYAASMLQISGLIQQHRMLADIKESGLAAGIFSLNKNDSKGHIARIASEDSQTMSPLNDVFTTPEFVEAYSKLFKNSKGNWAVEAFSAASGLAKAMATIGDQSTHVVNFFGNFTPFFRNGYHIDFLTKPISTTKEFYAAAQQAKSIITGNISDKALDKNNKYVRNGVLTSFEVSEVDFLLNKVLQGTTVADSLALLSKQFEKVGGVVGRVVGKEFEGEKIGRNFMAYPKKFYTAGDAFFKVLMFELETQRMQQDPTYNSLSKEDFEKSVGRRIRNLMPSQEVAVEAIKTFSKLPGLAPFITFRAENIRNRWHTLLTAKEELQSKSRQVKINGAVRLLSLLTTPVAGAVAGMANMRFDEEDREALNVITDAYDKNGSNIILSVESDRINYFNFDRFNADAELSKAISAAWFNNELSFEDGLYQGLLEAIGPFIAEDIFSGDVVDLLRNKQSFTGDKVYDEKDPDFFRKTKDIAFHLTQSLITPAGLKRLQLLEKAYNQEIDSRGDPITMGSAVANNLGFRTRSRRFEDSVRTKAFEYKESAGSPWAKFRRRIENPATLKDEDIQDLYSRVLDVDEVAAKHLLSGIAANRNFNASNTQIMSGLTATGLKKSDIKKLMSGREPSRTFSKESLEKIRKIPDRKEQLERVLEISLRDPNLLDNDDDFPEEDDE
jgi:DNA repair exonuclease SbcCD ATPase subunit